LKLIGVCQLWYFQRLAMDSELVARVDMTLQSEVILGNHINERHIMYYTLWDSV